MLKLEKITKNYFANKSKTTVLNNISIKINQGDLITIYGKSGSGKTTLLSIAGTMLSPDSGKIYLNDKEIDSKTNINSIRQKLISFIFQDHCLLPEYNMLENIMLPSLITGKGYKESKESALSLLDLFDLQSIKSRYPNETSRGEKQRISLLRALINKPKIIFADEPTGNLDKTNCELLLNLIVKINKDTDTTFVIATHDKSFAKVSDITYNLNNGLLTK